MTRDFAAELAALKQKYVASVPDKLDELTTLVRTARTDGAFAPARTAAHKLAGTAGSYGLERVGALAGEIESVLVVAAKAGTLDETGASTIDRLLGEARAALEGA